MLNIRKLEKAMIARLPYHMNKKGGKTHATTDGSDWKLSAWSNALAGEVGESANIIKKIERGDFSLEEAKEDLGREFGDIQAYLTFLAYRAGVDLEKATINKFNEVSDRINCPIKLTTYNPWIARIEENKRCVEFYGKFYVSINKNDDYFYIHNDFCLRRSTKNPLNGEYSGYFESYEKAKYALQITTQEMSLNIEENNDN